MQHLARHVSVIRMTNRRRNERIFRGSPLCSSALLLATMLLCSNRASIAITWASCSHTYVPVTWSTLWYRSNGGDALNLGGNRKSGVAADHRPMCITELIYLRGSRCLPPTARAHFALSTDSCRLRS